MPYTNPGESFIHQFGPPESIDDVISYARYLREESGIAAVPPIDLAKIYARFDIPPPKRTPLPDLQGMLLDPESGLILINEDDLATRQRFTEAHELMEILFTSLPCSKGWAARRIGVFKTEVKERLCNEGAAELLMPYATFAPRVRQAGVSYQTARQLAVEFRISITAALVRAARVGPGLHAVVLWRMKNKPTEIRAQGSSEQLSLFADHPMAVSPKKLRVEWTLSGPMIPYIPRDKSVPEDSSIYKAWQDGVYTTGQDNLELGKAKGTFRSENQPFESQGERCVLSLLHLPNDEEHGAQTMVR